MEFANGAHGTLDVSAVMHEGDRGSLHNVEIYGENGSLELDFPFGPRATLRGIRAGAKQVETLALPERLLAGDDEKPLHAGRFGRGWFSTSIADRAFIDAIVSGQPASPDFYDGWRAQAVIDAAIASMIQASGCGWSRGRAAILCAESRLQPVTTCTLGAQCDRLKPRFRRDPLNGCFSSSGLSGGTLAGLLYPVHRGQRMNLSCGRCCITRSTCRRAARPSHRAALAQPEIAHYVSEWGQPADRGFIAVDAHTDQPIGAAWLRLFSSDAPGYGFVDDRTPEVSIALLPDWRSRGIGSELLIALLAYADTRRPAVSLSVDPANPALRLYERLGFERVGLAGGSVVMVRRCS